MEQGIRSVVRHLLPLEARREIVRLTRWPPVGLVRFGNLRRVAPISDQWGSERGQPIDRYYIERFLAAHANDICGHVLEIGTDHYTRLYGGARVIRSEVLHVAEPKPGVTVIGDLTCADFLASNVFDCIILTQTLQVIYDVAAALRTAERTLKPGGRLLITVPGISRISHYDMERWGHYWSFTSRAMRELVGSYFPVGNVQVEAHGNVLAAIAFLHGLAAGELQKHELDSVDPDYEVLVTVRAVKPAVQP